VLIAIDTITASYVRFQELRRLTYQTVNSISNSFMVLDLYRDKVIDIKDTLHQLRDPELFLREQRLQMLIDRMPRSLYAKHVARCVARDGSRPRCPH
jgi:hypothetical protein